MLLWTVVIVRVCLRHGKAARPLIERLSMDSLATSSMPASPACCTVVYSFNHDICTQLCLSYLVQDLNASLAAIHSQSTQLLLQMKLQHPACRHPMDSELFPQKHQSLQPTPQKPFPSTALQRPPPVTSPQMLAWPHRPFLLCKQPLLMSLAGRPAPAAVHLPQHCRSKPPQKVPRTALEAVLTLSLVSMLLQQVRHWD